MLKLSALLIAIFCLLGVAFTSTATIKLNDASIIDQVNNDPNASWKATSYDRFEGKTVSEVGHLFGAFLTNGVRPSIYAEDRPSENQTSPLRVLPDNFDSRTKWPKCIHPIRNQEQCGSCWAFSSSEMLSDRFCIASNGAINTVLSPQFMVSCDKYDAGCNGGGMDSLWKFLTTTGTVTEECWPYESGKGHVPSCRSTCVNGSAMKMYKADAKSVKNFRKGDVQAIQQDIMDHGPIMSGFMVYQDFMQYSSGVYHHVTGSLLGGHAIKVVGWGVDSQSKKPYWIIANSWGSTWGMNGFFHILRGSNECQIEQYMYTAGPLL